MVFWSSFSKKIKQAVSQISFDALKRRVDTIEADYATKTYTDNQNNAQDVKINANSNNITTNTNNITALDTKVDGVISGLQNGNIINYTGPFDAGKTYSIAQATTYQDKWYVSNQNNNVGHTPSGASDQYWELLSEPTINLQPYLTKTDAANTYATITTVNGINTRLTTAEQTLSTNSTNIVNLNNTKASKSDVYTKTEADNKYALKSQAISVQNIPMSNFRIIRNQVYFGNRRIRLYDMINVNVNLGLVQNVVLKSNDNIFVAFSWYIDVYNNVLKIILDRFDSTNDWTPNFSIDLYTRQ